MQGFSRSAYLKVDCPDGPRYILKNPEKAFSIIIADWNVNIKALINFLHKAEMQTSGEVAKQANSIVEKLTEKYATVQAHYQAAYLNYSANPCSKEAERTLSAANAEIREMSTLIMKMEISNFGSPEQEVICESCGSRRVKPRFLFRRAKPEGKISRQKLEVEVFECSSCKTVFREITKTKIPNVESPKLWDTIPTKDMPKAIKAIRKQFENS